MYELQQWDRYKLTTFYRTYSCADDNVTITVRCSARSCYILEVITFTAREDFAGILDFSSIMY